MLFTIIVTTISSFPDRKQEEDLLLILTIPLTRLETEQKHGQLMWDFIYILVHLCDYDNYLSICIIYTKYVVCICLYLFAIKKMPR